MPKNILSKKTFFDLDFKWIDDVQINLSAVERRTVSLTKRRTVKKEYQAAWLLKSITLLDLTTLNGDDTFGKVDRLCQKALQPISLNILNSLELEEENIFHLIKINALDHKMQHTQRVSNKSVLINSRHSISLNVYRRKEVN